MPEPVTVGVTLHPDQYLVLCRIADAKSVQVHHLIEGLVRRALTPTVKTQKAQAQQTGRVGRPSKFTPELGARILEARLLGRSWSEIAAVEGVALCSAQRYAKQAKEQNQ